MQYQKEEPDDQERVGVPLLDCSVYFLKALFVLLVILLVSLLPAIFTLLARYYGWNDEIAWLIGIGLQVPTLTVLIKWFVGRRRG